MPDFVNLWDWVQTLTAADLPTAPFSLHPAQVVVEPGKWLRKLQEDALEGPGGPRALGSIQKDLRGLHEALNNKETR